MRKVLFAIVMIMSLTWITCAAAAELTIGTRTEPSIDPHFMYTTSNLNFSKHIFGMLVESDENGNPVPGLAESWKPLDQNTWEFKLRDAKCHDGKPFTAEDVKFSIERIPNVKNSPTPLTGTVKSIASVEIVDPKTVKLITKSPNPNLPMHLTEVPMVVKRTADGAETSDFNSGKAAIGAGPYKFVEFLPGDKVMLERFDGYWGTKPAWDKVTFKVISDDAARVAALMGKDVDFIDYVPPTQAEMLKKRDGVEVFARASDRIIYLFVNVEADSLPAFTDAAGKELGKNPLRDKKVRKAIAMSINRQVIVDKVMKGLAQAETQTIPKGWYGYNPDIKNPAYDPAKAKALLAEAGYPDGFGITVYGPNDRYVNDSQICQAVGQMMSQAGLKVKVDTMPKSVFFTKTGPPNNEFTFGLLGWGNTPVSTDGMEGLIHSNSEKVGMGQYNAGGYANPEVDALIEKAARTVDMAAREKLVRQASALAMEDVALIPLHTQYSISAGRAGLTYTPRADEGTLAMNVKAQ